MNVKKIVDQELDVLLFSISKKYGISLQELKVLGGTVLNVGSIGGDKCYHKFISGKNKGSQCASKPTANGYCSRHQSTFLKMNTGVGKLKNNKTITKTQQQIIDWLNTAVSQDVTKLKKRSKGLFNEETEFIFDEMDDGDYIVQAKYINKKKCPLSQADIEKCEKMGWMYNEDNIEENE